MDPRSGHELALELAQQREWLHRIARALVGADDAEDLAQATYVVALEHAPPRTANLRAWLAGIARNLARDLRRSRARRPVRESEGAREEAQLSASEIAERVESERRIAREVLLLSEPLRDVLLLRYHEGLTSPQISARLGVAEGTVRTRIQKGLAELRERLRREFGGDEALGLVLLDLARLPAAATGAGAGGSLLVAWKIAAVVLVSVGVGAAIWTFADRVPKRELAGEVVELAAPGVDRETDAAAMGASSEHALARVPSTAGAPRMARLRVLESDGTKVAGQRAWLLEAGTEPSVATLDVEGVCEFSPASGPRTLILERESAMPARVEREFGAGEHVIELLPGGLVEGRVLVNGRAPEEALELELWPRGSFDPYAHHPPSDAPLAGRTWTGAGGEFQFRGVPGAALELVLPWGFSHQGTREFDDFLRPSTMLVDGPTHGLRIELEPHRRVHGRIVHALGGTPVVGATVNVDWVETQGARACYRKTSGPDGRFWFSVSPAATELTVEYGRAGHARQDGRVERKWPSSLELLDLGDLALAATREVTFRVREASGAPIANALVQGIGRTDDRGELRAPELGEWADDVLVRAWGYRAARARLPAPPESSVEVLLEPTTLLTIKLREADGRPAADAIVRIGFEIVETAQPSMLLAAHLLAEPGEVRHRSSEVVDGVLVIELASASSGRVRQDGLPVGVPIRLVVADDAGAEIRTETIVFTSSTERQDLSIELPGNLRHFTGLVVDSDGNPLDGARVQLEVFGAAPVSSPGSVTTGTDGRFMFTRLVDRPQRLIVTASGFVPYIERPFLRPRTAARIVLERARDVILRVLDDAGAPVSEGEVVLLAGEVPIDEVAELTEPGTWRIQNVGGSSSRVRLVLAGRWFEAAFEGGDVEAELRVPRFGQCAIEWELEVGSNVSGLEFVIDPIEPAAHPIHEIHDLSQRGEHRFERVLPGTYDAIVLGSPQPNSVHAKRILAGPVRVVVEAGKTARVRLTR